MASSVSRRERGISTKLEQPSSRSNSSNGVRYLVDEAGVSRGFGSLAQSEVGTNWFAGGTLIPGGGLGRAPAGLLILGPGRVLQATVASVSVAGVFGEAPGGPLGGAASGAAHFFLNTRTCHQASISFSSSFGSEGTGWRRKAASCSGENSIRMSSQGVPLTTSRQVTIVSPWVRLFSRIMMYCTKLLASQHMPP